MTPELREPEVGEVLTAAPRTSALDPGGRFLERPLEHALSDALLARDDRRPIHVTGPSGVGKTALLSRVARRLLARGVPLGRLAWAGSGVGAEGFEAWLAGRFEASGASAHRPLVLLVDDLARLPGAAEALLRAGSTRLRVAAGDSELASRPGWRRTHLGPRTADEWIDDPGRRAPVRERSLREALVSATRRQRFEERRPALRARRTLVLAGGFPEAQRVAEAARDAGPTAGGLRTGVEAWIDERVLQQGFAPLAERLELAPTRLRELCVELAARRGRALRSRELAASQGLAERHLTRALEGLEALGWIERSAAYGRRGMGAEFAVHWPCVALRRAMLRGARADGLHPRLSDELDGLLAAHAVAIARARGTRLLHLTSPGALALVLDDGRRPVALLASDDGAGRRGLLRRAISKHPELCGGCFLVLRDPLPLPVAPGEDGIGSLSLDQALLVLGRRVRGLQLAPADPLAAGVQQLAF